MRIEVLEVRGLAGRIVECPVLQGGPAFTGKLRFFLLAVLGFTLGFMVLDLRADEPDALFQNANKSYEEGKYADAVASYDKLLASGSISEPIYFNRGNALFKMGQVGRAIASYRVALSLSPRDSDLRANLQIARARARGGSASLGSLRPGWLEILSLNEWTWLATGAIWLLFILLALGQWRPELYRTLRSATLVSALAMVMLGCCLAVELTDRYFNQSAIVIAGEADVRNGPLDESQSIYKVRDGVELGVLDRKDGWLQVVDPAHRTGWLHEDQVLMLETSGSIKLKPPLVLH